jgi:PPK2 family polyphosphate:nucleotide phosphotransferase
MAEHNVITGTERIKLDDFDPADTGKVSHAEADRELGRHHRRLARLQSLLYAAQRQSVLVVLQGMDTSGKDSTVQHVMTGVNLMGCDVTSFKVPTPEEQRHDFLWRVHMRTPALGVIGIFNRSHYEDVLVARVHELVPRDIWEQRYAHINHFEHLLAQSSTLIFKFFLHISSDEQRRRLLAREKDIDKAWKLSPADWQERSYWDDYRAAYEDAISRCSAEWAPWYIVPTNDCEFSPSG